MGRKRPPNILMRRLPCLFLIALPVLAQAQAPFELQDRDRVVLAGDGLIERAQRYGYLELALTTPWPDRALTFRNLGWSGDTVRGEARDHYTNPPTAYEHLIEQITTPDPTVIILGYGGALAFKDAGAIQPFTEGLNTLLDDLAATEARCVLLSPIPHDPRSSPNPEVERLNEQLARVRDALATVAPARACRFVDLFGGMTEAFAQSPAPLTTDGLHLNAEGYRHLAALMLDELGIASSPPSLMVDMQSGRVEGGQRVGAIEREDGAIRFSLTPPALSWKADGGRLVTIKRLARGDYTLWSEGQAAVTATASEWERGVSVDLPAERMQVEALRAAIVDKNALYFRQYRPQNETYLVGFRRYEQGQNAPELDQLGPLIDELENEIGRLQRPRPLVLSLTRE